MPKSTSNGELLGNVTIDELAKLRGQTIEEFVHTALLERTGVSLPHAKTRRFYNITLVPGATLEGGALGTLYGTAKLMCVGKSPFFDEVTKRQQLLFTHYQYDELFPLLEEYEIAPNKVFMTNVLRFRSPLVSKTLPVAWVKLFLPLLQAEAQVCQAPVIGVFGSDALKVVLNSRSETISKYRGQALELDTIFGKKIVVTLPHPFTAELDPTIWPEFVEDLRLLLSTARSGIFRQRRAKKYTYIMTMPGVLAFVREFSNPAIRRVSVDSEWGNVDSDKYGDWRFGGKLRTIQLSHSPHTSSVICLRGCNNEPILPVETVNSALQHTFPSERPLEIWGHNIRADSKFLCSGGPSARSGVPQLITNEIEFPDFIRRCEAGVDTILAYHCLYPAADGFGLERLSTRYADTGRYDIDVDNWLRANGLKAEEKIEKHGYALVPNELLLPYAAADTDVVLQAGDELVTQLKAEKVSSPYDYQGKRIETLYDVLRLVDQPSIYPLDEVERVGFQVDVPRLLKLGQLFLDKFNELIASFRTQIGCASFNPRSPEQLVAFCFGEEYTIAGKPVTVPDGVMPLHKTPVKTSGKPSRNWGDLKAEEHKRYTPATDTETLQTLINDTSDEHEKHLLMLLRNIKLLAQTLDDFLAPPEVLENGEKLYTGGYMRYVTKHEHRITTNIVQLTSTGRNSSKRANLQNPAKKREPDFRKIMSLDPVRMLKDIKWEKRDTDYLIEQGLLPEDYCTLRSCLRAFPGCVLIEADYKQAELFLLAGISGDKNLKTVLSTKGRDLHSEMAVDAFKLDCTPADVKRYYVAKRTCAKSCIFGLIYGRGPKALVREVAAQGIDATEEEMQLLIDLFFEKYPLTKVYIEKCHRAVDNPGYVENIYGRRRNFYPTLSKSIKSGQRREAQNSPIQGSVADTLTLAFYDYVVERDRRGLGTKLALPFHDALLVHSPVDQVKDTVALLDYAMVSNRPLPGLDIRLQIDLQVMDVWGTPFANEEIERRFGVKIED